MMICGELCSDGTERSEGHGHTWDCHSCLGKSKTPWPSLFHEGMDRHQQSGHQPFAIPRSGFMMAIKALGTTAATNGMGTQKSLTSQAGPQQDTSPPLAG